MSSVVEMKQGATPQAVARATPPVPASALKLTRAQKAAVVIAMLGEAEARPIVERLDDRTMAQVATALETISTLAREDLIEIAVDFLRELRAASGSFSGGQDKAREIIANLLDQNRYQQIYGSEESVESGAEEVATDTWQKLERHDPQKVADYFSSLTPNIIALILRRIDVAAASEIVLAHMLEIELLNKAEGASEGDDSHLDVIGEMLSLVPSDRRDRILAFLSSTHESKLKSIERVMFTIDSLPEILPREVVSVVFRELGDESMTRLLASLRTSGGEVTDYLLSNISSRLADQYRLQLEDVPEMSPEKVEKVQREFLLSLMSLKRDGTIKIGKPEED